MSDQKQNGSNVAVHTASTATTTKSQAKLARRRAISEEDADAEPAQRTSRNDLVRDGKQARRIVEAEYGDDDRVRFLEIDHTQCFGQLVAIRTDKDGHPSREVEPLDSETVLAGLETSVPTASVRAHSYAALLEELGLPGEVRSWGADNVDGWEVHEVFVPHRR